MVLDWNFNVLSIIVCGLIYFGLGALWYAVIFGKPFASALSFTPDEEVAQRKHFPLALLVHFVCGFVTALAIAVLIRVIGITSVTGGMALGSMLWGAFTLTTHLISSMFERRPNTVFAVNAVFYLVAYVILGAILAVWRAPSP